MSAVERRAAAAAKERRADRVRPGWWVYSHGARGGSWDEVATTTSFVGPDGRAMVRLVLAATASSRGIEIECVAGYPASCVTAAEARKAGLTDNPEGI